MMNDIRRFLLGGLVVALTIGLAGSATALPALQLGPGSLGDWSYDTSTDTWVTGSNPFELLALANATNADGGNGAYAWDAAGAVAQTAYLVASAVPQGTGFDGFDITLNGGALVVLDSGVGTPPVADPNDLAPHGVFATYFGIYAFDFDGPIVDIYDAQTGGGSGKGYIEAFTIMVNSLSAGIEGVHFDLFTLEGDGTYGSGGGIVKRFAPFSHDATFVPEPTGLMLFSVGLLVAGHAIRRR
jgi:hypothetical protein